MRRRVTFRGRVQGVGFRATARAVAASFRVTGWVRNEPDGSVLLEVQGSEGEIRGYLAALDQAMGRNISGRQEMEVAEAEGESGFAIRY